MTANITPPNRNDTKKTEGASVAKKYSWLIVTFIAVVVIGSIGWFIYASFNNAMKEARNLVKADTTINDDDDDTTKSAGEIDSLASVPFSQSIKTSTLNINGSSATYILNQSTDSLFSANTKTPRYKYLFEHYANGSDYVMNFRSKAVRRSNYDNSDTVVFKLNTTPVWSINIDAGATELNFDLSKYKVRTIQLKGGAGTFTLKLGQPLEKTDIDISTGAADITIEVPKDAACHIETNAGLSSTSFDGFTKQDEENYVTANFKSAKNKIYIKFSGGVSDFKVHRY
jgi:hypothetical protein